MTASAAAAPIVGDGLFMTDSRSVTDREEPRRDHGAARSSAPRRRWGRARGRRRGRTVLRLEQIRHVLHPVDGDGLGAAHRGDGRHDRVLVRRLLLHDGDVAVAPGGDVDQPLRGIPPQGVDAIAIRDGRHDLAGDGVYDDGRLAATREDSVGAAIVGDSRWAFAGARGQDASTRIALTSITWMVFLP